jgi:hypothetical protein
MSRKNVEINNQMESDEEIKITHDLLDLQMNLDHYLVKYPDERTINNSIEQLRNYVPRKRRLLQKLYSQVVETIVRIFPFYRFTSIGLFLFGTLLLPNKLY